MSGDNRVKLVVWRVKAATTEGKEATYRLLGETGAAEALRAKSRVMVKVNVTANLPPESGVITFPWVLDWALAYLAVYPRYPRNPRLRLLLWADGET
ncbi:MAG: hypothetical protein FJ291_06345 [Planctomycetes bacterium]|nr:hypothetical protein [Planctomycetota bacterium]